MKLTRFAHLCLVLLLLSSITFAQQPKLTWYPFDTDFISAKYSDSAISELRAKVAHAAKNVPGCERTGMTLQTVLLQL